MSVQSKVSRGGENITYCARKSLFYILVVTRIGRIEEDVLVDDEFFLGLLKLVLMPAAYREGARKKECASGSERGADSFQGHV